MNAQAAEVRLESLWQILLAPGVAERFWSKVDRQGGVPAHRPELGPCWVWTAGRTKRGYGNFHAGPRRGIGRALKAHRVAWALKRGRIPEGLSVLHRCDNRACVYPGHLFLGTQVDNIADMKAKGRARGKEQRGERHALTQLTDAIVLDARRAAASGEPIAWIAHRLGFPRSTVHKAIRGESFSYLPDAVPAQKRAH